jgi:hypothetical protein
LVIIDINRKLVAQTSRGTLVLIGRNLHLSIPRNSGYCLCYFGTVLAFLADAIARFVLKKPHYRNFSPPDSLLLPLISIYPLSALSAISSIFVCLRTSLAGCAIAVQNHTPRLVSMLIMRLRYDLHQHAV